MSLESTYAPNVDPKWAEAFIFQARLREIPGAVIGDALAEVDAHVVDSGESAEASFGDPKEYANSIAPIAAQKTSPEGWLAVVGPIVAQSIGMGLVTNLALGLKVPNADAEYLWARGIVGILLLVAGTVWAMRTPNYEDPIVGPGETVKPKTFGLVKYMVPLATILVTSAIWLFL